MKAHKELLFLILIGILFIAGCRKRPESWHGQYLSLNPTALTGEPSGSPLWKLGQEMRVEIHLAPDGTVTTRNLNIVQKGRYRRIGDILQIGDPNNYIEFKIEPHCLVGPAGMRLFKQ